MSQPEIDRCALYVHSEESKFSMDCNYAVFLVYLQFFLSVMTVSETLGKNTSGLLGYKCCWKLAISNSTYFRGHQW